MGQQHSYGKALNTYNEKKAVIIGQINVQTSADHMTEIVVALGNSVHPQLWNVAIMEIRSTDMDFPLTYRRFCMTDPQNEYQQYIPEKINSFSISQRRLTKEFHEKKGEFWIISTPSCIQEQQQTDEQNVQVKQVYPFCDKMKKNIYREQYKQAYIDAFQNIEQEMSYHSTYISVGILDMKPNNPLQGIDNFSMTSDIIEAFIQCTPKIHKLIFISEIESQSFIMGMALKDQLNQINDITQRFLDQEKQKIVVENNNMIKDEMEIQFKQEENIQLNSNNVQQVSQNLFQMIQKPYQVSYQYGHKQNVAYQFFRDFNVPLNQNVFQTIVPIRSNKQTTLCLCGRNTTIRTEGNFCCYCTLQRPTIYQCEERGCGRMYCGSCFNPSKFYNLCTQGHKLKFVDGINNNLECCSCRQLTYRQGYYICNPCSFKICGYCYYSIYAQWQFKKMKIYLNQLKKIKPNYRQEVFFQLITQFLLDANLAKLRQ